VAPRRSFSEPSWDRVAVIRDKTQWSMFMTSRSGTRQRAWRSAAVALLAGCLAVGSGSSPATAALPASGDYRLVGLGGKCMEVADGNPYAGTPVVLNTCNYSYAQLWHFDNDRYQIEAFGKCLDVPGARFVNGNQLRIWSCNNTPAQQFRLHPAAGGGYTIRPFRPFNFCVEAAGGSTDDFTPVQLYLCNNTASQVWHRRWL
jgi:hypothetical protein